MLVRISLHFSFENVEFAKIMILLKQVSLNAFSLLLLVRVPKLRPLVEPMFLHEAALVS